MSAFGVYNLEFSIQSNGSVVISDGHTKTGEDVPSCPINPGMYIQVTREWGGGVDVNWEWVLGLGVGTRRLSSSEVLDWKWKLGGVGVQD